MEKSREGEILFELMYLQSSISGKELACQCRRHELGV